mmetsp:Transcript_34122/g.82511  ORF Transcript_34122/g.82511 Transcript_34122/m.82511 type:complete len:155 (-) Transcript_34122:517-981(-)|eukprot:CAMPEP_0181106694 /NCGR_PEP_ID=MMETSP1071-20121207/16666_1 /TAXON_ID=35127 /ORGANISM="Thalassiosira sp., Strain NH16" /LENGTH=154 /DNA_ID=CAMNT_0023190113 /DNA_START=57 /DNA_END=521 /DNA_ORIENTATION=+
MDASSIQAIKATAVLSIILFSKVFITNVGLGGAKKNAGGRAPEDTYQANADEVPESAKVTQDRAQRIVNNDLENCTYTLTMAWGAVYCIALGGNDSHALAHIVMFSVFVVCRIGHSIAYSRGIAMARSLIWAVGGLCSFGIGINGAIASFGIEA